MNVINPIFTGCVKRVGQGRVGHIADSWIHGALYGPWIYIIAAPHVDRFKIGYTERAPFERMNNFETGSPVDLHMLAVMWGLREDEKDLQREFAKSLARRREWFGGIAQIMARFDLPWVPPHSDSTWFVDTCAWRDPQLIHADNLRPGEWYE